MAERDAMSRQTRRGAFTLIELLVVIAVIMLLAALALPAMHRVQRMARRVGCISNMRQMYTTFATYAKDFDDQLPKSAFEYYKLSSRYDSVPGLKPYVPDPRILYCTMRTGVNIDTRAGSGGNYCGWNHHGEPYATYVLSNIAVFFNPDTPHGFGGYDGNLWAVGVEWREPRAAMVSHRRVMRYDQPWNPYDWRCQNWYPHGNYHDMIYGDGRNETHSQAEWQVKPKLWIDWFADDKHVVFY